MDDRVNVVLKLPAAEALLTSRIPARLAFIGLDDLPRVIPIWFHWNGRELAMFTHAHTYKARSIRRSPAVAVTIDTEAWPYRILTLRGEAMVEDLPAGQPVPESDAATARYIGEEAARHFADEKGRQAIVRIALVPSSARLQEL